MGRRGRVALRGVQNDCCSAAAERIGPALPTDALDHRTSEEWFQSHTLPEETKTLDQMGPTSAGSTIPSQVNSISSASRTRPYMSPSLVNDVAHLFDYRH